MQLLFVLLFFLSNYEFSAATVPNRCGVGYKSHGYTEPAGDIYLQYGEDLNITCVLNPEAEKLYGPNASSLMGFHLGDRLLPVEVINASAIRLYIKKHQKTKQSLYYCKLRNVKDPVCSNVVVVGVPPLEVTDFSCIGINYQNFTCSFTPPENYILTYYSLYYSVPSETKRHACPNKNLTSAEKNGKISCTWSMGTDPQYRHSHTNFTFYLDAFNHFGYRNMSFLIKHYERIMPSPPESLIGISTSPHSIELEWTMNLFIQTFPIGLIGRVSWWIEEFKNWTSVEVEIQRQTSKVKYELKQLPYAHCLYDIRVALKSPEATDEALWSPHKSVTVRTMSKEPDCPPKTTNGMFEPMRNLGLIRIYWQNILANQENGENFSYFVEADGHPDIKPVKLQKNYADFRVSLDVDYTFRIWSKNQIGKSNESSLVYYSSSPVVETVEQLIKVDYGNGSFDIHWREIDDPNAVSYTLFWCSATKERPHPCDGRIYWETLPLGIGSKTENLPTLDKQNNLINIYQFAIAVNGVNSSSGMSWADCTVTNESEFQFRETHVANVGPRYITLKWELECIRMGTIKSFEVKYCQIPVLEANECPPNSEQYKVFDNTDNSFGTVAGLLNVTELTPYTSYMFMVKPILISGKEMKFGLKVRNSTSEDAPTQPQNLQVVRRFDRNVTIHWDAPAEINGFFNHYTISFDGKTITLNDKNNLTADITGLLPRTKYNISLMACTTKCSQPASIEVTTDVGMPGLIKRPGSNFEGNNLTISWAKPDEPGVKVDFYEVEAGPWNGETKIHYTTDPKYNVDLCQNDKSLKVSIRVRAVNKNNSKNLTGPWTDRESFVCWEFSSSSWTVPVIVMGSILFIVLMGYTAKTLWYKVVPMRDCAIKLPASLGPAVQGDEKVRTKAVEEPLLLEGASHPSGGNPSGESSGCSSGTESVASSADSASRMSISDSGTDQPKSPSPSLTEPLEKDTTIRQRPSVKKAEYLTMAEIPQTSWTPKPSQTGYSVIGLSSPPVVKEVADPPYLPLSEIAGKSSFPAAQTKELPKPSSGYVACPPQEPPAKNTGYVVAGVLWKTD